MRLILIGCGKAKRMQRCPARDLYTGNLFFARMSYAEEEDEEWWVVSARHGLVDPEEYLSPYDETIGDLTKLQRSAWGLQVCADLLHSFAWDDDDDAADPSNLTVELHMGDAYARHLVGPLNACGLTVERPLKGLGVGQQLAWYRRHALRTEVA